MDKNAFRNKWGNSPLRTVYLYRITESGKLTDYQPNDIYELRMAVSQLIVAAMNLEAECDDSEMAQAMRNYEKYGVALSPSMFSSITTAETPNKCVLGDLGDMEMVKKSQN